MQTDPVPTYTRRERDRRWKLARTLMQEEGLDALLIYGEREGTGPAPFCFDTYFTNDRPGTTVLFPRKGDPVSLVPLPMYISDHFESAKRGEQVWIAPDRMRFPCAPASVAEVLREFGAASGTIGVVGAEPYPPYHFVPPMPMALSSGLAKELPGASFKPVAHRLSRLAFAQSEEELAVIRHVARIGDEMVEAMLEATRPGVSEGYIYAAGMAAAFRRGVAAPGMLLGSGPESIAWGTPPWIYRPRQPRAIEDGDVVLAEVFVACGMKETQHQVTIAVGEVHEDFHNAEEAVRAAYDAGLEALTPGTAFGDVVQAMREPIEAAGGRFVHPVVHGLNPFGPVSGVPLAIGELPGAETYRLHAEIPPILHDLVLEKGMTFAFEPNCAMGRRAVNLGGTVVVGADQAIELNPRTAEMLHAGSTATAAEDRQRRSA